MKIYTLPIILLFVVVYLNALYPELSGIIKFLQVIFYFSLVSILISDTAISSKSEIMLLKWTLVFGLILPILLKDIGFMSFDPIYVAIVIILVPISFHELMKKNNGNRKSVDMQNNLKVINNDEDLG